MKCEYCLAKKEQFCDEGMKGTYQGMYNGELAQGGEFISHLGCQNDILTILPHPRLRRLHEADGSLCHPHP